MQIERLFEMVYILMGKKNITAKKLAEHFEVSTRTIYRDIDTLSSAGIPIYTTKGKGGGIGLLENFILNKSLLSKDEQQNILSSLYGFKAFDIENVDSVISKLGGFFDSPYQNWIEIDFSAWNNYEDIKQKFEMLKEAILKGILVELTWTRIALRAL